MAARIRIQTPDDGSTVSLVELLARHGITGASRRTRFGSSIVAIDYDFEEAERLLEEVDAIVEQWMRDADLDSTTVTVGERSHRVRPTERSDAAAA